MKIEQALDTRKKEIEELNRAINSLFEQADKLRDVVKKYKRLRKQAKQLKEMMTLKQSEFNSIVGFFKSVDDNYLNKMYPLFASVEEKESAA